jgi:hydrogenase expression/formation protein HypE
VREEALPVPPPVKGACGLLGLDPLFVANEGILTAVVDPADADRLVSTMRLHVHGRSAAVIGTVDRSSPGMVLLETAIGGSRIIDMLPGEMLPRIC